MDQTLWGRLSSLPRGITEIGRLESLPHKSKLNKDVPLQYQGTLEIEEGICFKCVAH
jgi:hypothetical protein